MNSLETNQQIFDVLKKALWNIGKTSADKAIYEELKTHAVASLAAPILPELGLTKELYLHWEKSCIWTIVNNQRCQACQASLPVTEPYVVLKGTCAAQYYPYPEYRTLGDIDIMASHEDYNSICESLLMHGFIENTDAIDREVNRHRGFMKNGIEVEVHSFYALRDDPKETEALDNLIIQSINSTHILPDLINGLTLIEHINHHLEAGLGLRQILDWMMFVDKCLPDEKWPAFEDLACKTGHVQLAKVTTRMCELYLGLSEHIWCNNVDTGLCAQFMEYVLSCGNFGRKKEHDSLMSERLMSSPSFRNLLKTLRHTGLNQNKTIQKHSFLHPFAGLYLAGKYVFKGLSRKQTLRKLKAEYINSKKRNELFNAVGIAREKKGRVIYRNGKYVNNKL